MYECEVEGVELLSRLYGCEPIISDMPYRADGEIDFVDNWSDYAVPANNKTRIGRLAQLHRKACYFEGDAQECNAQCNAISYA